MVSRSAIGRSVSRRGRRYESRDDTRDLQSFLDNIMYEPLSNEDWELLLALDSKSYQKAAAYVKMEISFSGEITSMRDAIGNALRYCVGKFQDGAECAEAYMGKAGWLRSVPTFITDYIDWQDMYDRELKDIELRESDGYYFKIS